MTIGKMLRNISFGLLFGVLAMALLPFLLVFNWAEMLSLTELEASPLFMLLGRYLGGKNQVASKSSTGDEEIKS